MSIADKIVKDFNPTDPNMLPNRHHLESPFELLHFAVATEDPPNFSIFMANTVGAFYNNFNFFNETIYDRDTLPAAMLHTHEYYEFLYVVDGEIYQNIDCLRHYYPRGGCCVVAPEIPHSEEYNIGTSARLLFLKLNKDYVHSLLTMFHYFASENTEAHRRCAEFFSSGSSYLDFIPQKDLTWQQEQVHSLFSDMANLLMAPGESASLEASLLIYKILMILFDKTLYGNTPISPGTEEEIRLFMDIHSYMENMPGKCTRKDLEEHFHFSGDYLYKVVKNHSGLSIYDYNMRICMKKAADLLRSTDMNINDIAELVGFRNYTQFYNVFRRHYFMTPRQYRLAKGGQ